MEQTDPFNEELGPRLSDYPRLKAIVNGGDQALKAELVEFVLATRYERAPRRRRVLLASMTLRDDQHSVAIVRDISETGIRLWVDGEDPVDAASAEPVRVEVKIPGSDVVAAMDAVLVRVAGTPQKRGIELAFQFKLDDTSRAQLERLLASVDTEPEP